MKEETGRRSIDTRTAMRTRRRDMLIEERDTREDIDIIAIRIIQDVMSVVISNIERNIVESEVKNETVELLHLPPSSVRRLKSRKW